MISLVGQQYQGSFTEQIGENLAKSPSVTDARLELLSLSQEYTVHSTKQTPKPPGTNIYSNRKHQYEDVNVKNPFLQTLGGWEQRHNTKLKNSRVRLPNQLQDLAIVNSSGLLQNPAEAQNRADYRYLFRSHTRPRPKLAGSAGVTEGPEQTKRSKITAKRHRHLVDLHRKKDPVELLQEFYEGDGPEKTIEDSKSKTTVGFLISSKNQAKQGRSRVSPLFSSVRQAQVESKNSVTASEPRFRSSDQGTQKQNFLKSTTDDEDAQKNITKVDRLIAETVQVSHHKNKTRDSTGLLDILKSRHLESPTVRAKADSQQHQRSVTQPHANTGSRDSRMLNSLASVDSNQLLAIDYLDHQAKDSSGSNPGLVDLINADSQRQKMMSLTGGFYQKRSQPFTQPKTGPINKHSEKPSIALLGPKKFSLPLNSLIKEAGDRIILDSKLFPGEVNPVTVASLHHPFSPWTNVVMNHQLNLQVIGQTDLIEEPKQHLNVKPLSPSRKVLNEKGPSSPPKTPQVLQKRPLSRYLRSDRLQSVQSKRVFPHLETPTTNSTGWQGHLSLTESTGLQELVKREIRDIIGKKFIKIHMGSPRVRVEPQNVVQISDAKYNQLCRKSNKSPPPKSAKEHVLLEQKEGKVKLNKQRLQQEHQHKLALFLQRKYLAQPVQMFLD